MARHATIEPAQSESSVLALDGSACEGRLYPTSDTDKIYVGLSDGSLLGPIPTDAAPSGGSADPWEVATLSASGETSMVIRYQGDTPTLSKVSAGTYSLSVPADTVIKGFYWLESGATFTGSGTVILRIVDADSALLYGVFQVFQGATGEQSQEFVGIIIKQTSPTSGTVQTEYPNMGSLSGGFVIVGQIL
jgi:hypothetical protein